MVGLVGGQCGLVQIYGQHHLDARLAQALRRSPAAAEQVHSLQSVSSCENSRSSLTEWPVWAWCAAPAADRANVSAPSSSDVSPHSVQLQTISQTSMSQPRLSLMVPVPMAELRRSSGR